MKIEGFEGLPKVYPFKKTGRLDIKTVVLVILHGSLRRFHHQYPTGYSSEGNHWLNYSCHQNLAEYGEILKKIPSGNLT